MQNTVVLQEVDGKIWQKMVTRTVPNNLLHKTPI